MNNYQRSPDVLYRLFAYDADGNRVKATVNGVTTAYVGNHYESVARPKVWVDEAVPAGATLVNYGGDTWTWVSSNPPPASGALAHPSAIVAGEHQHYFYGATQTLFVPPGSTLFAHVYLDPANVPSEVMLQWNDGNWEHRAYWGANNLPWGVDGTDSRRYRRPLPLAGQWVRLEVPASSVGLEGRTLNGMAFSLYGGRATWDQAGVDGPTVTTSTK